MAGRSHRLALALALALGAATAARLPAACRSGNALNHVSGSWITLGRDLAGGTLYRPLVGPEGIGGTRDFPLSICLHALAIRLGGDPIRAGVAVSIGAGALLVAALALLLARLGAGGAAPLALLPLAGSAVSLDLLSARGDLLPVALQALGLAAVVRGRRALPLAAAAFALAITTKPTAAAGLIAAAAWLALRRERQASVTLLALTSALAAIALGAAEIGSAGRFSASLRACATGGAAPGDLLRAPLRLAALFEADRGGLLLLGGAAAALAAPPRRASLAALWLGAALVALLSVMASPGTDLNHLADVEAASAVVLGLRAGEPRVPRRVALAGAVVAALAGLALAATSWTADLHRSRLADADRAAAAARGEGALLSEDPLVPLVAGERPVLLDAFMYRLLSSRDPAFGRPLEEALRGRRFRAVILLSGPETDRAWFERQLGPRAIEAALDGYSLAVRAGPYLVFLPRRPDDATRAAITPAAAH